MNREVKMSNNYETLELDKNGIMLKLPSFYSRYTGSFFTIIKIKIPIAIEPVITAGVIALQPVANLYSI